jgi:glycine/D-amino acid oxidase-like deaminating enzyme
MMHVAVVGAGAFGGWTALALRRRGARVTLLDAWGPGHVRSSSGGETRVIRATYGTRDVYTSMAIRALDLWRAYNAMHGGGLIRTTGVLWMFRVDDGFRAASASAIRAANLPIEELHPVEAARRFPQVSFEDVTSVLWEPEAGYLFARRACQHVVERFVAEGGTYEQAWVKAPIEVDGAPLARVPIEGGETVEADVFVFACGPWLGGLLPSLLGTRLSVTRQEVYYFGTPAGDARFLDPAMPVWLDYGERVMYGIPGNAHRGFKIADDTSGPPMDPTMGSREVTAGGIAAARAFMRYRFPALMGAPLLGSEVCQYESTPDAHYVIDRHPGAPNVWIAGGGSGHGFKMGPVIGEMLAACVLDGAPPDPLFALARFATPPAEGWQAKWS